MKITFQEDLMNKGLCMMPSCYGLNASENEKQMAVDFRRVQHWIADEERKNDDIFDGLDLYVHIEYAKNLHAELIERYSSVSELWQRINHFAAIELSNGHKITFTDSEKIKLDQVALVAECLKGLCLIQDVMEIVHIEI